METIRTARRLALATAIAVALAPAAQAATFTVNSTDDAGPGTLRAALEAANGNAGADTIEFDATTFAAGSSHTIALQSPLTITDHLTVTGPGPDVLALDGGENVRIVTITPAVPGIAVALSGLSLRDGFGGGGGGCIGAVNTHLVITDSAFTGCSGGEGQGGALLLADSPVGPPPVEGLKGLVFPASLTVRDSRFVGNRAAIGGAISANIEQGGGITVDTVAVEANEAFAYIGGMELIAAGGEIVLQDSVISGNVSGGVGGGLGAVSYSTIRIEDTEVTGNQVRGYSYGLYSYGGGAAVFGLGDVLITGSRFENNALVADEGMPERKGVMPEYVGAGGGLFVLPATAGHSLVIEGSHFVGNGAGFGGGLLVGVPGLLGGGQAEAKGLKRHLRHNRSKALEGSNSIVETRIQGNVAGFGGTGLALLDFSVFSPTSAKAVNPGMTLDRVTLSANAMAPGASGGPVPGALLILGPSWPVQLLNSTVSGNSGGIFVASPTPAAPAEPVLLLDHSTIANNDLGGVIIGGLMSEQPPVKRGALAKWAARYKDYPAPELNIAIRNSVLAGNADEELEADLIADPETVQMLHSLVQTTEPADFTGYRDDGGNQFGVDPLLAPLALAGHAFLEVHVPQSGSPLIDAGDPEVAASTPPATDERGAQRIAGEAIDIGAVEIVVPGSIAFDPDALTISETEGTATIVAMRSGGSDGAVSVNFTTADGSAFAGADYTAASGTLSWDDGDDGPKSFEVPLTDDALIESDETFTATLSDPTGGATLAGALATVTLTSDDLPPVGTIELTTLAQSVDEIAGTATLSVARTGGSFGAVSVDYGTSDAGATAGSDYTAASGTLTWADGDAEAKDIVVPILDDALVESPENVALTLSNVTGGATLGADSGTVTIVSEDVAPPGTLALAPAALTVNEADGTATFSVTRTGGSAGEVSVSFATANGSAAAGSDYTATAGTLTWADGDTAAKSIVVPILDDTEVEADEQFSLTLTEPTGGASLGAAASTVTIASEDVAPPGTLAVAPAALTINEPDGTATLSVTRSGGSAGEVSVSFATANGSAAAGSDYTATAGTLTWADGDTAAKSIVVPIVDDTQVEDDEQFSVTLTEPTGGASLGAAASTVTIASEDVAPPGTLAVAPAALTVNEPDGTATLSVTRSGGSAGEVSVNFATANGTALAGSDFTATAGTLTWADGDTAAKSIIVPILDDTQVEGDEQFSVTLASPTGGASLGAATAGVTIVSEDLAPTGSLQFDGVGDDGMVTLRFNEDGTPATPAKALVQIAVTRSGGSAGEASIDFATVDGTATAPADYTATSGTLSWADGESGTKFITVNIVEDGFGENDENFRIVLSNAQGAGLGINAQAQIVVVANGAASSTAPVTIPAGDTRSWLALLGAMLAAAWVGLRRRMG